MSCSEPGTDYATLCPFPVSERVLEQYLIGRPYIGSSVLDHVDTRAGKLATALQCHTTNVVAGPINFQTWYLPHTLAQCSSH